MEIKVKVDVSPSELREFLGLPDVAPIQNEMMEQLRDQMNAGAEGLDPANLLRPYLLPNLQNLDAMQRAFWQAFTGAAANAAGDDGKD